MLATVAAATGLALAVPALADPPPGPVPDDPAADAHFLDTLNQAGMTFRNGPDAVAAGRMACNMMISGRSETDVINELAMRNPGLNSGGAMKFAALASSTYCPDYLSKSSVHTTQPLIPGLGGNR